MIHSGTTTTNHHWVLECANDGGNRVPTVLEKSLNFGFSLKSPWKWICPWKVLEFRGPSLKFQLVVLDFLFSVFWTESLNGYSKLRGTRANFSPKNLARFARNSLQVKYFSSSSCSYKMMEQLLSYPSFPKNTYMYLCIGSGSVILLRPKIGLAPQKHDVISMPIQQYTNTKHIPIESYHPVVSIMPRHMDPKKIFSQNLCCREVKIDKISEGDLTYFSLKCDNLP